MAIAQVGTTKTLAGAGAGSTATSAAIDTTGATLLVLIVTDFAFNSTTDTVSDSKSNTWHPLINSVGGNTNMTIWYSFDQSGSALAVGSGHTISVSGSYVGGVFTAWSGTHLTSPYNGNVNSNNNPTVSTTIQSGNLPPAANGNLLITGFGNRSFSGTSSIDSSFSLNGETIFDGVTVMGCASAHKIATSSENPTWTNTAAFADAASIIAEFVVASGGGGGPTLIPQGLLTMRCGS